MDAIGELSKTGNEITDENGNSTYEINIFKYELLKVCVERLLNEYEPDDENDLGAFKQVNPSISFKFAFNTLLLNKIIIEKEEDYE